MVMGQFVTTYRKDYLWPYVRTLGIKPEPEQIYQPQYRDPTACPCHCLPHVAPTADQSSFLGPQAHGEDAWSRLGPMGPLLDPKMYPAKVAAAPESKVSRFNQPNVFLQRLQEKYPFIYECLRTAPPGDILSRINRDRLASTYQVDYCKKQEYPSAPYDELIRAAGVEGLPPCPEPRRLPGDACRPLEKDKISKRVGGGKACGGVPRAEEAKYCGGEGPSRFVKKKLHCPRKPPGPYYRPYTINDNFSIAATMKPGKKSCKMAPITGQITTWNPETTDKKDPLAKSTASRSATLLNAWGQMVYRDVLHVHGGLGAPKPKLKK